MYRNSYSRYLLKKRKIDQDGGRVQNTAVIIHQLFTHLYTDTSWQIHSKTQRQLPWPGQSERDSMWFGEGKLICWVFLFHLCSCFSHMLLVLYLLFHFLWCNQFSFGLLFFFTLQCHNFQWLHWGNFQSTFYLFNQIYTLDCSRTLGISVWVGGMDFLPVPQAGPSLQ